MFLHFTWLEWVFIIIRVLELVGTVFLMAIFMLSWRGGVRNHVMALFGAILPAAIYLVVHVASWCRYFRFGVSIKVAFVFDLACSILFTVVSCLSGLSAWADCSRGYTGWNYSPLIEMVFMVAVILTILFLVCVIDDVNFYDVYFGTNKHFGNKRSRDEQLDQPQPLVPPPHPEHRIVVRPPSTTQPNMSVNSLGIAPGRRSHRRHDPSGHSVVSTPTAVGSQSRTLVIPEL